MISGNLDNCRLKLVNRLMKMRELNFKISLVLTQAMDSRVACLILLFVAIVKAANDKVYTNTYDNVDVDAILKNDRILKRYVDCLMERTNRCTPDAKLLKELLPEALKTDCAKCTEQQKKMAGKILAHILQYKRNYWEELTTKYDPDGTFRKKHGYEETDIDYSNYE